MKYPKIKVKLTGTDGNAFSIIGLVTNHLKKGLTTKYDLPPPEIKEVTDNFKKECMAGSYDNLLQTCMEYVEIR